MKTLLLLRHAKSSWDEPAMDDHDRPLNKRGKQDAPRAGQWLAKEGLLPELIYSSTAKRARATVELAVEASNYQGDVLYSHDLYAATPSACLAALAGLADKYQRVMLVGHNPGLEELLLQLTGELQLLPTAALAQISLPIQKWGELNSGTRGKLLSVWRPKEQ